MFEMEAFNMKCKKCGQTVPKDCKFCTFCGAEIDTYNENSNENSAENPASVPEETAAAEPEKEAVVFSSDDADNAEIRTETADTEAPPVSEETVTPGETETGKAPKRLSAGRAVGASVISIFTVIFLIFFNFIFCGRIGLSGDIVRNTAKSLKSETLLDSEYDGNETVLEYIYGCLDKDFIRESGAEAKDIRNILVKSDFNEFVADKLGDYAWCIINGEHEGDPSLTADEIKIYLEEHDSVFTEELDYRMTVQDYEAVSKSFERDGLISDLSIMEWNDHLGFSLWNVHFAFSFINIGIVFALVLVLYIWTAIVLDKNGRHIMGFFGNVTLIAGIVTFLPSVIFLIGSAHAAVITGSLAAYAGSRLLLPFAVIAACTGLFEIIVGVIFRKINKHIKKRALRINGGKAD